jgi:hypothetical protein
MSNALTTRAGFDDELALVSFEEINENVEIGSTIVIINPGNNTSWVGTVVDMDPQLQCMYVRVDTDAFVPEVAYFEETGEEAQREPFNLDEASDMTDLDLFESKSSGQLFTLRELERLIQARRASEEFFPFGQL